MMFAAWILDVIMSENQPIVFSDFWANNIYVFTYLFVLVSVWVGIFCNQKILITINISTGNIVPVLSDSSEISWLTTLQEQYIPWKGLDYSFSDPHIALYSVEAPAKRHYCATKCFGIVQPFLGFQKTFMAHSLLLRARQTGKEKE